MANVAGGSSTKLQGSVAGAGTQSLAAEAIPKGKTRRTSTYAVQGGRRAVKAYPVLEKELVQLAILQGTAALFFAISGACGGFWLSVWQSISFAGNDVTKETLSYWSGLKLASGIGTILFILLAVAATVYSGLEVGRIKRETNHE
jgi:hypothetical protein